MKKSDIIARVLSTIDANTEKPEKFLGVQDDVELELRKNLKILYDFTREKTIEHTIINNSNNCDYTMPKLVIEDVDHENIWQQLELQNESIIQDLIVEIGNITAKNNLLKLSGTKQKNNVNDDDNQEEKISDCDENPSDDNEPLDSNNQIEIKLPNNKKTKTSKRKREKNKLSIVDDKFFKLSELDKFLNNEDKKEFTKKSDSNSDHDSDEESIDLFNNYPSEDDDDDDDDDNDNKNSRMTDEDMETDIKSSLDLRTERAEKKITKLETENIKEKTWSLKGETKGDDRPTDALLEDYLDYDVGSRPAPVMTETTNFKLEDIIKQRIKDNTWDDVQRKVKPIETPTEYKKKLVMDQEKSKKSLAEIYEDSYLKQKQSIAPNNSEHQDDEYIKFGDELIKLDVIREDLKCLFQQLDALSNNHCTPKQAQPDLKIISNVPAINMEEVAPVATSDATLLAPEEVQAKNRGDLKGKSELTTTDQNRNRKLKKKAQKLRRINMEAKEKKLIQNNKKSKSVDNLLIKKLTADRNIKIMK
ncbi:U3 small nucleolar ribonucleoprotein protein MPP10 isoform X2 [Cotesia glomerata]|uniref:U3 small nucleolar ribonucleoprotein protein MPP10 isoform X2 n=1 Tax=Cotesia glomerata TaxID=32391 RepID=UPI001D015322|nr:U3 small nucleolar ribonucleoprotein protein MPP10 isoform X2 [Cotesia glomerata]